MARLLIAALQGMGHHVSIISGLRSFNRNGDPAQETATQMAAADEVKRLAAAWDQDPNLCPDLLFTYHVYHKAADYIAPALSARFGRPYVIAEPSVAPKRETGPWAAGYAQAALAIRAADALLAITSLDRTCLTIFAGASKVHSLPPFLDPSPFSAATDLRNFHRKNAAAQFAVPPDVPWLLAVGMMRPGDKLASYLRLAEVLALVQNLPWHVLLVGDGAAEPAVRAAFAPLAGRSAFLGQLEPDALAGIYAASDLYVWPAINEAYGMALLEAQAAGLPVLSVNTRGVPDIVHHGETGWLVTHDDAQSLASGLSHLLENSAVRSAMSRAAVAHVSHNLSMTAAQERLSAIFAHLGLPA